MPDPKVRRIGTGQSAYAEYTIDWGDGKLWYYSLSPFHNEKALYAYRKHKSVLKWANDIKKRAETTRPYTKESQMAVATRKRFPMAEGLIDRYMKENGEDPDKEPKKETGAGMFPDEGDDEPKDKKDEGDDDDADDEGDDDDKSKKESRRFRRR